MFGCFREGWRQDWGFCHLWQMVDLRAVALDELRVAPTQQVTEKVESLA
jgi:hypothetical protein